MENVIITSLAITFLYVCVKIIEMKFIDKQWKPVKQIIKDAAVVLISSVVVTLSYNYLKPNINEFFSVVTDSKVVSATNTQVFTDEPNF